MGVRESQKDGCYLCALPLGERVWRMTVLPWVFCSEACVKRYAMKDGEEGLPPHKSTDTKGPSG
jgi:hypothetical protein